MNEWKVEVLLGLLECLPLSPAVGKAAHQPTAEAHGTADPAPTFHHICKENITKILYWLTTKIKTYNTVLSI